MAVKVESPETISRNIKDWNIPVPSQKYKVVIHCSTYNHEKYIEDALKGFVMQKTNFPFCAIIIDDCSTDGTADIVRKYADEYPDIIIPICLGYNHMQHGLSRDPYFKAWHEACEYLAQCEGDDYWIDALKLQKQVDFLDNNPQYGLAHTMYQSVPYKRLSLNVQVKQDDDYLVDLLNLKHSVGTQTVVYRMSVYDKLPKLYKKQNFGMGDYPLWIEFAKFSKVKYLSDCTAIYRLLPNSASHNKDINKELLFINNIYRCSQFYAEQFHIELNNRFSYYESAMKCAYAHKDKRIANDLLQKALKEYSVSIKTILFFMGTHSSIFQRFIKCLYNSL